ncbi:hypothetical protein PVAP13_5NG340762 [Panicum virgatum]|uniref:Uncharacterized protein n=1 Tax=Panicum virgatum TaxID=38727 RepID=A0A8T0RSZ9_PANVG|nr:hypothetical protein PVAP13_5NG340762 [Panicum virgatum]
MQITYSFSFQHMVDNHNAPSRASSSSFPARPRPTVMRVLLCPVAGVCVVLLRPPSCVVLLFGSKVFRTSGGRSRGGGGKGGGGAKPSPPRFRRHPPPPPPRYLLLHRGAPLRAPPLQVRLPLPRSLPSLVLLHRRHLLFLQCRAHAGAEGRACDVAEEQVGGVGRAAHGCARESHPQGPEARQLAQRYSGIAS